ncbi:MAG: hypothetical protein ACLT76_06460 [Clostridium fessum]
MVVTIADGISYCCFSFVVSSVLAAIALTEISDEDMKAAIASGT